MGLGTRKIKQEMTGTGGGRYMRRAEAKAIANKARRRTDAREENMSESKDREYMRKVAGTELQGGIRTHAPSREYDEGWERVFGKKHRRGSVKCRPPCSLCYGTESTEPNAPPSSDDT